VVPYKIVLADDHVLFRQMTKKNIETIPGIEVSGEASDGQELLDLLKKLNPDMVILDITMPKVHGIQAIKEIRQLHPDAKILVLTMHKAKEFVYRALSAGADGYLVKENTYSDLVSAIEKIRDGGSYISSLVSGEMMKLFRKREHGVGANPQELLSARERQVLNLIAAGKSSKEIAETLTISAMTVYNHRINIKKKLGIKKNFDLIKYSLQKEYPPMGD
jgi:DNA-binding NarL/FixJ family response regulator